MGLNETRWEKFAFLVVLILMFVALALYGYLGTFTRYMADDYSTAGVLAGEGFWKTQQFWWNNWSGRYSFTFVVSLVELLGLWIVPVLPVLISAAWFFSITWACLPILRDLKGLYPFAGSAFIASIVLWVTYRIIDDYPQIVFWQTGILTYPVSPILFLVGLGGVARHPFNGDELNWRAKTMWFIFAFLAGGFSETGAVIQIALLGMLLLFVVPSVSDKTRALKSILIVCLLGSFISLFVMTVAPGNVVRSGNFHNIPPLGESAVKALGATLVFIPRLIDQHTIVFAFAAFSGVFFAVFCIPAEVGLNSRLFIRYAGVSLFFVEVGVLAGILPAFLLRGTLPPERALLFPYFLVVCLVVFWGGVGFVFLRSILPRMNRLILKIGSSSVFLVLMILGVVPFVISQFQLIAPLKEYSMLWDKRHRSILSSFNAGESVVVVADFTKVDGLRELRSKLWITGDFENNPGYWINQAAARYYGVDQIIAE